MDLQRMQMGNQCLLRVIFSGNTDRVILVYTVIPAVTAWKFCIVTENIQLNKTMGFFNLKLSVQSCTCKD